MTWEQDIWRSTTPHASSIWRSTTPHAYSIWCSTTTYVYSFFQPQYTHWYSRMHICWKMFPFTVDCLLVKLNHYGNRTYFVDIIYLQVNFRAGLQSPLFAYEPTCMVIFPRLAATFTPWVFRLNHGCHSWFRECSMHGHLVKTRDRLQNLCHIDFSLRSFPRTSSPTSTTWALKSSFPEYRHCRWRNSLHSSQTTALVVVVVCGSLATSSRRNDDVIVHYWHCRP